MIKILKLICTFFILVIAFFVGHQSSAFLASQKEVTPAKKPCIVLDAGHGGEDPGKVAANGTLEKDINLSICLKLAPLLEAQGFEVILTRTKDLSVFSSDAGFQKREDLQARVSIIAAATPLFCISIHQNSYPQESVSGPQVFHYSTSNDSKTLAQYLQQKLNTAASFSQPRTIKANNDYFLLRKTTVPTVIVECGFLSNPSECERLTQEDYQQQLCEAIVAGILCYTDCKD